MIDPEEQFYNNCINMLSPETRERLNTHMKEKFEEMQKSGKSVPKRGTKLKRREYYHNLIDRLLNGE